MREFNKSGFAEVKMFIYALYIPDDKMLPNSNGYDDCAICRAWTKRQAISKFKRMYCDFNSDSVKRVRYNHYGIAVISNF